MKTLLKVLGAAAIFASPISHEFAASACDLSQVDEKSAQDFVERYYDRLSHGMNRDQLRIYWSVEKNELLDKTISRLATDFKHDFNQEAQRFLDSMGTEALCESLQVNKSRVSGYSIKSANLSYKVTPKCTDWKNNNARTMTLRYSDALCTWVITGIENEVRYR